MELTFEESHKRWEARRRKLAHQRLLDALEGPGLLLDKCGFEAGFQWFFPLKKKLRGKPDDEIDAEILKHLAHPHRIDEGS